MKTHLSKHTFFEYLAGRANPMEKRRIEEWILQQENNELFHQWLMEYESKYPQFAPEQDLALEKLLRRLDQDAMPADASVRQQDENAGEVRRFLGHRFWLMAASVILMVGCAWWMGDAIRFKTYQTAYGQTTDIYLEDGSKVTLNSNSRLSVPRFGFDRSVRKVMLEGEAEFSVSHTVDHKRFVVKTSDQFSVEVLGTTFSVFARPRGTKVALTSGSVRIDYSKNDQHKEVMMVPGDLATLDPAGEVQLERKQNTRNFSAWKEKRYVFNATSIREIAWMIEENFGQKISFPDSSIAQRTITGNFKTKDAEELLRTISEVLDIRVEQNGDTIFLTNN